MNILVLMNSILSMLPTGTAGYLVLILVLFILVVLLAIKNRKLVCEKKRYKDLLDDMQENNKEKEALFSLDILENLPFPFLEKISTMIINTYSGIRKQSYNPVLPGKR